MSETVDESSRVNFFLFNVLYLASGRVYHQLTTLRTQQQRHYCQYKPRKFASFRMIEGVVQDALTDIVKSVNSYLLRISEMSF